MPTAKMRFSDGSMTGVPVMPTCGLTLPQGRPDESKGVDSVFDHCTVPVAGSSA